MRFVYPARLRRTGPDEVVVSFRDLPECLTSGANEIAALAEAADALDVAIADRIVYPPANGDPIPVPSARSTDEHGVAVPADTTAKAALMLALRESGLSRSALARRLAPSHYQGSPRPKKRNTAMRRHAEWERSAQPRHDPLRFVAGTG